MASATPTPMTNMPFRRFLDIILFKAYADLRAERERTYLGFLWWFFEPLMFMAVFWLVFDKVLSRGTEDFVPFVLVGLVMWQWLRSGISHGSSSVLEAKGLIQQVRLPPVIFPLVTLLSDTVKFGFVLGMLLIVLAFTGHVHSWTVLALPAVLLAEFALLCAITIWMSALIPFVPDLRYVTDNILMAVMFLSGIFYDASNLPEPVRTYFYLNPSAFLIQQGREVLLYQRWPDWNGLLLILAISLALCVAGAHMLERMRRYYPKLPR
jgi:lipopolysaccharide transport system permease protein